MSTDSLSLIIEGLRYISESHKNMIFNRATTSTTVFISLLTFFSLMIWKINEIELKLTHFQKKLVATFILFVGFLGITFIILTQFANNKNQTVYLEADKKICTIIDSNSNKNFLLKSIGDYKVGNRAWFGHWIGCCVQGLVIALFAILSTLMLLNCKAINIRKPEEIDKLE